MLDGSLDQQILNIVNFYWLMQVTHYCKKRKTIKNKQLTLFIQSYLQRMKTFLVPVEV